MQEKKIVWLDCDPGLDDTFAIIMAAHHKNIKLIGVSTSAGNTSLQNTTKNALDILYNIGKKQIPVVEGSDKLIHGKMQLAEHMHGSNGLGGVDISPSSQQAIVQNKFEFIRDTIMKSEEKIIWANTGALTNLCILLRNFPELKQKIQKIVMMGGAIGKGNITPAAQFNIYFDPYAAKQVLQIRGEIPFILVPLQLTHEVRAKEKVFEFLSQYENIPFAKAIFKMLDCYKTLYKKAYDFDYPPIHDPCVINYITNPQNFKAPKCKIVIDIGEASYGRTNCYFSNPKNPTAQIETKDLVCTKMNKRSEFWNTMLNILEQIFKNHSS